MKNFLKKEWFKLVCVLLAFYAITLFYNSKHAQNETVTNPIVVSNISTTTQVVVATTSQSVSNQEKPIAKKVVVSTKTPQRIIDQVKALDDFLEYDVVGTGVDCIVYATYNNIVAYPSQVPSDMDLKTMFPDSKESYESKCLSSYVEMNKNNRFVAEPELVDLRKTISEYAETVHDFSSYALDGKYSNSIINTFDKSAKIQRQDAREKVLAIKRKYNIQ